MAWLQDLTGWLGGSTGHEHEPEERRIPVQSSRSAQDDDRMRLQERVDKERSQRETLMGVSGRDPSIYHAAPGPPASMPTTSVPHNAIRPLLPAGSGGNNIGNGGGGGGQGGPPHMLQQQQQQQQYRPSDGGGNGRSGGGGVPGAGALAQVDAPVSMDSALAADAFFASAPPAPRADEVKRNAALFLLHHGYTGRAVQVDLALTPD